MKGPPNDEMQQTRHGRDGASLLISVFGGPQGAKRGLARSHTNAEVGNGATVEDGVHHAG